MFRIFLIFFSDIMDDFLSNFILKEDEKELSDSKKDVMKFLKRIGVFKVFQKKKRNLQQALF